MGKHFRHPLEWDAEGEWDGRVMMVEGQFERYLDRNGERRVLMNALVNDGTNRGNNCDGKMCADGCVHHG